MRSRSVGLLPANKGVSAAAQAVHTQGLLQLLQHGVLLALLELLKRKPLFWTFQCVPEVK